MPGADAPAAQLQGDHASDLPVGSSHSLRPCRLTSGCEPINQKRRRMSDLTRITDPSRTSRKVRKVPTTDMPLLGAVVP